MPQAAGEAPIVFIDDARTFGGAQIALAWGVRALLLKTSHPVICVCPDRTKEAIIGVVGQHARLTFVHCPAALPLNIVSFVVRLIPFVRLVLGLRRRGGTIWCLNLSWIESCLAPLLVLKLLRQSYSSWLHCPGELSALVSGSLVRRVANRTRDALANRLLFRLHPSLATPTEAASQLVMERSGSIAPVFHLYPTLSFDSCRKPDARLQDSEQTPRLWMIGRVEFGTKNNAAALSTLQALRNRGRSIALVVVGDGPDMGQLRLQSRLSATDAVHLVGWKSNPWSEVGANDVVLVPSVYEGGVTLVAIEAMLRGLRVVTTPLPTFFEGVPREFIAAGFTGELLADQVESVLRMNSTEVGNLYSRALLRFSEEHFVDSFFRLQPGAEVYRVKSCDRQLTSNVESNQTS